MRRDREADGREEGEEVYRRRRGSDGQAVILIEGDIRHNSREYIPRIHLAIIIIIIIIILSLIHI